MNYYDLPLTEAEICRLILAEQRVRKAREAFRLIGARPTGFTEPRAILYPHGYSKAEHDRALDRILNDLKR